jgi:hypothetical protein
LSGEKLYSVLIYVLSDFADARPNCQVVGTDLSPIQPSWIPPNLSL